MKIEKLLTIFGRKPVLEALSDNDIEVFRLHLSDSNKETKELKKILQLANKKGVEILYHSKRELSFISKNSKQDQGVALDILMKNFITQEQFLESFDEFRLLAVDGVTNPQNLGLIIRSATAGNIDAIIIPKRGTASLVSSLTIKASAGTIFKIPIIQTQSLVKTLKLFKKHSTKIYTLDSHAQKSYKQMSYDKKAIFILGNESVGVSKEIETLSDESISIPMRRGVESLNVAMSATLISFLD
jgi:23S rRNA (guanosine2251-2'-O)-methyltransferase